MTNTAKGKPTRKAPQNTGRAIPPPPMGWVTAVYQQEVGIRSLASVMEMPALALAEALNRSGYCLQPDPQGLAEAGRSIIIQRDSLAKAPDESLPAAPLDDLETQARDEGLLDPLVLQENGPEIP